MLWRKFSAHANLLDVHTDHLESLGSLDEETHRLGRGFARVHHRLDDIGRDQDRAWDAEWTTWYKMHDMESVIAGVMSSEQEDRFEVVAWRRRIAQLESTVGRLESTVEWLAIKMERLRLEHD